MNGSITRIEDDAVANTDFRHVVYTARNCQLVLMCLRPLEEIGVETHVGNDQFFRIEKGYGKCLIDGREHLLQAGDAVVVPAGAEHNFVNLSDAEDMKLYTIYSPPHHRDGLVMATKAEAEESKESFDGKTTETLPEPKLADEFASLIKGFSARVDRSKLKRVLRKLDKNTERLASFESKIKKFRGQIAELLNAK